MKYFVIWVAFFATLTLVVPPGINVLTSKEEHPQSVKTTSMKIKVYFPDEGKVNVMEAEQYIQGVLMAEMPAEFEPEALKAQAVAARTYMAEKLHSDYENIHPEGAVMCTDFAHCQAYISEEDAKNKWGKNASLYLEKCQRAVDETKGVIAVYDNMPIKAVFHSVSGGNTESASDVWGDDVPYLVSIKSDGEESAPKYKSTVELDADEFKTLAKTNWDADVTENIITDIVRSSAGGVMTAQIGNKTVKGTEIRKVFGLNSTDFDVVLKDNTVVFNVRGYGHRVGMSQYGANHYAKEGLGYRQILQKYYNGIDFADMNKKSQ